MPSQKILYTENVNCTKGNEKSLSLDGLKQMIDIKKDVGLYEVIDINTNEWDHPYFEIDLEKENFPDDFNKYYKNDFLLKEFYEEVGNKFDKCNNSTVSTAHTDKKISYHIIFPNVIVDLNQLKAFKDKNTKLFDKLHLDKSVYRTYGKFRIVGTAKYIVKKNGDIKQSPILKPVGKYDLSKHLITYLSGEEKKIDLGIPVVKNKKIKKQTIKIKKNNNTDNIDMQYTKNDTDLKIIRKLIGVLADYRADDYELWYKVGFCLKNIHIDLFDDWLNFSKRSEKYDENACIDIWNNAKVGEEYLGEGSLHRWAQEDNFEKYLNAMFDENEKLFEIMDGSFDESDVANVLHYLYKKIVKYEVGIKSKVWYYFENHRWHNNGELFLQSKIKVDVNYYYRKLLSNYVLKNTEGQFDSIITKINSVCKMLRKSSGIKGIISNAMDLFMIEPKNFSDKMDENRDLIGFNNGVYDLKNKIFRDGNPDDLVSYSVGYDYNTNVNEDIRNNVLKFFTDIFQDEDDIVYTKNLLSYCLAGHRFREKFNIWIGRTRNGKGTLIELLKTAMGQYIYEIDADLLCDPKNNSTGANSALANSKGKRILVASEPKHNQRLQADKIKAYAGGDKINTRHLYGDAFEFVPQFQIIIQTNTEPDVAGLDEAYSKRVEMTDFPFTFVDDPKQDHEKKRSNELKENFKREDYGMELIRLLLENYKYKDNFATSKNSIKRTQEYLGEINVVQGFITENYVITDNKMDMIGNSALYNQFKLTNNNVSNREFKNYLGQMGIYSIPNCGKQYYRCLKEKEPENMFNVDEAE